MMGPRHAVPRPAGPAVALALKTTAVALSAALALTAAAMAAASVRMARRVVTPAVRLNDTPIVSLDTAAQTITLKQTPDTILPGRYGLFTTGTVDYLKLGSVLAQTDTTVTRKLLTHVAQDAELSSEAAFSGWYFQHPDELHLDYSSELIPSPLGHCPAWLFPAGDGDTWAIHVHGRGALRAECLRGVPDFSAAGITSLVVSYRNDGEAPRSRAGTYGLGATEWRDVEAAVEFAQNRGAKRIVLMGWSMGGAIAMQVVLNSEHQDLIAGVVLESPVIDWRVVLDFQARMLRVPAPIAGLAISALKSDWATPATGAGSRIPFEQLDVVARAAELHQPVLILHSDDDGFVPSDASHDLVVARPDLVEIDTFEVARHAKLWNYDQQRWSRSIQHWLKRQGLTEN